MVTNLGTSNASDTPTSCFDVLNYFILYNNKELVNVVIEITI